MNPESGKNVSVYGRIGQKVLKNYLKQLGGDPRLLLPKQSGGAVPEYVSDWSSVEKPGVLSSSLKPPLCPGCSEVVDPSGEHGKKPGLISNIAHPHEFGKKWDMVVCNSCGIILGTMMRSRKNPN